MADIWSMRRDGSDKRQLTTAGLNTSPDERTAAYVSSRGAGVNLWRMDIDGGNQRQIEKMGAASPPVISPEGRSVVFSSGAGAAERLWRIRRSSAGSAMRTPMRSCMRRNCRR